MEKELTNQIIIKLINLYRSHSLLWDATNKDYRSSDQRTKAFEAIAQEMGMTVEFVKRQIHSLHMTYIDEIIKMGLKKSSSESKDSYSSSLPWFTEMSFLDTSKFKDNAVDGSNVTLLKKQVDVIRFSRVIKQSHYMEQQTGMRIENIKMVLQNEKKIFQKWLEHLNKNILSSTVANDCDEIDVLLLEWVERCKMYRIELTTTAIETEALKLAKFLKSPSYFIKLKIWIQIGNIFHDQSNVIKSLHYNKSMKPHTLLELLKNDGRHLLKSQTYERFLETLKNSVLFLKNIAVRKSEKIYTKEQSNNEKKAVFKEQGRSMANKLAKGANNTTKNYGKTNNESIAISTSIGSKTRSEDKNTTTSEPVIKKEKSLECKNDERNFNVLEPVAEKEEIANDFCEEFIDISDNAPRASRSKVYNCPSEICQEIKVEPELWINDEVIVIDEEDNCDETQKVNGCSLRVHEEELKETIIDETGVFKIFDITGDKEETKKRLLGVDKNLQVLNKKIKTELGEISDQENKAKPIYDNSTNISENQIRVVKNAARGEEDMQVVFEIEDSDDEVKNELIEIINNYTKTTAHDNYDQENLLITKIEIKEEPLEANQSDNDDWTVLEITSDDGSDDNENHSQPVIKTNEQAVENLKRTFNEMEDNLPSTSQSANLFSLPTSSLPIKEEDLIKLIIKSKVEAFKYLHCIKKFFQSQNDEVAYKIITRLMMTFMICDKVFEKTSS